MASVDVHQFKGCQVQSESFGEVPHAFFEKVSGCFLSTLHGDYAMSVDDLSVRRIE